MKQYKVGIIGATGMVGQRFATLLENHPWFHACCAGGFSPVRPENLAKRQFATAGNAEADAGVYETGWFLFDATADVDKIAGMVTSGFVPLT